MFAQRLGKKPRREYRAYAPTYTARRRKFQGAMILVFVCFFYYISNAQADTQRKAAGATVFASEPLRDTSATAGRFGAMEEAESSRSVEQEEQEAEEEAEAFWEAQGSRFSGFTSELWSSTKERIFGGAMEGVQDSQNGQDTQALQAEMLREEDRPNPLVDLEVDSSVEDKDRSGESTEVLPRTFLDRTRPERNTQDAQESEEDILETEDQMDAISKDDKSSKSEQNNWLDDNKPNELLSPVPIREEPKEEGSEGEDSIDLAAEEAKKEDAASVIQAYVSAEDTSSDGSTSAENEMEVQQAQEVDDFEPLKQSSAGADTADLDAPKDAAATTKEDTARTEVEETKEPDTVEVTSEVSLSHSADLAELNISQSRSPSPSALDAKEDAKESEQDSFQGLEKVVDQLIDIQQRPIEIVPVIQNASSQANASDSDIPEALDIPKDIAQATQPSMEQLNLSTQVKIDTPESVPTGTSQDERQSKADGTNNLRKSQTGKKPSGALETAAEAATTVKEEADQAFEGKRDSSRKAPKHTPKLRGSALKEESSASSKDDEQGGDADTVIGKLVNRTKPTKSAQTVLSNTKSSTTDKEEATSDLEEERPEKVEEVLDSILKEIPNTIRI